MNQSSQTMISTQKFVHLLVTILILIYLISMKTKLHGTIMPFVGFEMKKRKVMIKLKTDKKVWQ